MKSDIYIKKRTEVQLKVKALGRGGGVQKEVDRLSRDGGMEGGGNGR